MAYHKWWSAVRKLLAAFELSPDAIQESAPPAECIPTVSHDDPASPSPYEELAPDEMRHMTVEQRDAWLARRSAEEGAEPLGTASTKAAASRGGAVRR